jgi:hypothetical protein
LNELRRDCAKQQKKGLHFILASIIIWVAVWIVHLTDLPIETKNILIAMWVFSAVPEKMLMVYAMIFGAHLMPYSWLYQSKSYMVMSIVVPILALVVGLLAQPHVLAGTMIGMEVAFSLALIMENKELNESK